MTGLKLTGRVRMLGGAFGSLLEVVVDRVEDEGGYVQSVRPVATLTLPRGFWPAVREGARVVMHIREAAS